MKTVALITSVVPSDWPFAQWTRGAGHTCHEIPSALIVGGDSVRPTALATQVPDCLVLVAETIDAETERAAGLLRLFHPYSSLMVIGDRSGEYADLLLDSAVVDAEVGVGVSRQQYLSNLAHLLELSRLRSELSYLRRRDASGADFGRLVGRCPAMQEVFNLVLTLCRRTGRPRLPPVLISGETGTGKGQLARAIHYNGARSNQSLLEVNCASLPPTLIEGELFGCERGAYTGADATRTGLLEVASGGTIFLDEIDTLNLDLQAKLLRFLDDRCIRRLGSTVERTLDVHVIAATHRDLDAAVRLGQFREDLYYRLGVIHLKVPPLRDRERDVVDLARSFLEELCAEYSIPVKRLRADTEQAMLRHDWPGNVRELRNRLERVALIVDEQEIEPRHLELPSLPTRVAVKDGAIQVELPREGVSLEAVEKAFIDAALDRCAGNVAQAARLLGLSRSALRYRIGR